MERSEIELYKAFIANIMRLSQSQYEKLKKILESEVDNFAEIIELTDFIRQIGEKAKERQVQ